MDTISISSIIINNNYKQTHTIYIHEYISACIEGPVCKKIYDYLLLYTHFNYFIPIDIRLYSDIRKLTKYMYVLYIQSVRIYIYIYARL